MQMSGQVECNFAEVIFAKLHGLQGIHRPPLLGQTNRSDGEEWEMIVVATVLLGGNNLLLASRGTSHAGSSYISGML